MKTWRSSRGWAGTDSGSPSGATGNLPTAPAISSPNDHLDLLDYLVARATERGIYMLFSPIQLYGSNWPDALDDTTAPGFGRRFGKARMGTDSAAIAAQARYLRQILNHVNPYTHRALKDEPASLCIALGNQPGP